MDPLRFQVPLDGIFSFRSAEGTTQLVICKFAESAFPSSISLMKILSNTGPSIDPWGHQLPLMSTGTLSHWPLPSGGDYPSLPGYPIDCIFEEMEICFAKVQLECCKFHLSSLQARLLPILMSPVSSLTRLTNRSRNTSLLLGLCTLWPSFMPSRILLDCLNLATVMLQYLM